MLEEPVVSVLLETASKGLARPEQGRYRDQQLVAMTKHG
jgi:hypothetical protein